jgi:hypothetical protein
MLPHHTRTPAGTDRQQQLETGDMLPGVKTPVSRRPVAGGAVYQQQSLDSALSQKDGPALFAISGSTLRVLS